MTPFPRTLSGCYALGDGGRESYPCRADCCLAESLRSDSDGGNGTISSGNLTANSRALRTEARRVRLCPPLMQAPKSLDPERVAPVYQYGSPRSEENLSPTGCLTADYDGARQVPFKSRKTEVTRPQDYRENVLPATLADLAGLRESPICSSLAGRADRLRGFSRTKTSIDGTETRDGPAERGTAALQAGAEDGSVQARGARAPFPFVIPSEAADACMS